MYNSPIMSARRGGGGVRVDARPTTFLKKYIWGHFLLLMGAFYFFYERGLFFMWRVIFFMGAFFFGLSPPPPPGLQIIVLAPMLPPHGRTKKFSEGVGNPKRPLIKTKKNHKDKKIGHPPPT